MISRNNSVKRDKRLSEPTPRQPRLFTEETLASLAELGTVLEQIHRRLISEGYEIKDGIIQRNETSAPKRKETPR